MPELTKAELEQVETRAATVSLQDDDVALITAATMPERLGIKGTEVPTAGADQHGATYSYTRRQVNQALEGWSAKGGQRAVRRGRTPRAGDRRTSGRRGAGRTTAPGAGQVTPAGGEPTSPSPAEAETGAKRDRSADQARNA
jgi:hypothetical protein